MLEFSCILAPALGGIIGYITNDIAIRMLFRPHKAKYIMGVHVPFTPGIIPKEKGRIAEAIGGVISENLMNKEVLERYLLSDDMVGKVRSAVEEFFNVQKSNNETVKEFLCHYLSEEEIATISKNVNDSLTKQTYLKLADSSVGEKVAHIAIDHVAQKLNVDGAQELLAGLGGAVGGLAGMAAGLFGGNIVARFLDMLREPAERFLADNINTMLKNNGNIDNTNGTIEGVITNENIINGGKIIANDGSVNNKTINADLTSKAKFTNKGNIAGTVTNTGSFKNAGIVKGNVTNNGD